MWVSVYKPDGTNLNGMTMTGTSGTLNLTNLPVTGTYTVVIDPYYGLTTTMTINLGSF